MSGIEAADKVEIEILVDNATDMLSSNLPFVESEAANLTRRGFKLNAYKCLCCAVHGLSCLVTVHRGDVRRTVLFDTGPEDYAFERNVTRLGVDLGAIESIVLSHGHADHAGAMLLALGMIRIPEHSNSCRDGRAASLRPERGRDPGHGRGAEGVRPQNHRGRSLHGLARHGSARERFSGCTRAHRRRQALYVLNVQGGFANGVARMLRDKHVEVPSRRSDDDHEDLCFVMAGRQIVDGQVKFDNDAERQSGQILVYP